VARQPKALKQAAILSHLTPSLWAIVPNPALTQGSTFIFGIVTFVSRKYFNS
jgi:hypothetical protein